MNEAELAAALRSAGCVFAEDEARLLTAEATSPGELMAWTARRMAGEPLEQIVGWAEFDGLRIAVEPGVFVPRRRTQAILAPALAHGGAVVVDLCCGSGALGAALAARLPDAEVWAADLDEAAVACARRNLLPERVRQGDLYDALPHEAPDDLRGRVDLLVVNAPYVPTEAVAAMPREARDHEHRVALDGGPDGLDLHRRVAAGTAIWLARTGRAFLETSREQADRSAALFTAAGLHAEIVRDDDLDGTVVVARRPS